MENPKNLYEAVINALTFESRQERENNAKRTEFLKAIEDLKPSIMENVNNAIADIIK